MRGNASLNPEWELRYLRWGGWNIAVGRGVEKLTGGLTFEDLGGGVSIKMSKSQHYSLFHMSVS